MLRASGRSPHQASIHQASIQLGLDNLLESPLIRPSKPCSRAVQRRPLGFRNGKLDTSDNWVFAAVGRSGGAFVPGGLGWEEPLGECREAGGACSVCVVVQVGRLRLSSQHHCFMLQAMSASVTAALARASPMVRITRRITPF
jgi:hypothetical protein